MNCYETLTLKGKNLRGYSPDTYFYLTNSTPEEEECEALLAFLEAMYG